MDLIRKVSIIGAGNVATHLSKGLYTYGLDIIQIYSRHIDHADELAWRVKAEAIANFDDLNEKIDLLILCVPDDALESVISQLPKGLPVVHTSGSKSLKVFSNYESLFCGIFYPLQTFSKEREIHWKSIPILIESNSEKWQTNLISMAKKISSHVAIANSEDRAKLHLAAVFASNFTNELLAISNDILKENDINFEWLRPLVMETVSKAFEGNPRDFQTGPAVRGDRHTIEKHQGLISSERLRKLYDVMTEQIIDEHKNNG